MATVDRTSVIKESSNSPDSTGGGGRRRAMLAASDIAESAEVNVAVEANLGAFLDKDWENKSLADILKAPVSALQGSARVMPTCSSRRSTSRRWGTWARTSTSGRRSCWPSWPRPGPNSGSARSAQCSSSPAQGDVLDTGAPGTQ